MKKNLKSIGLAILYFLAFIVIQFIFAAVFTVVVMLRMMLENFGNIDYAAIMLQVTQLVTERTTVISLIADVVVILILFIIFIAGKNKRFSDINLRKLKAIDHLLPALLGVPLCLAATFILNSLPIPDGLMSQYILASESLFKSGLLVQVLSIVIVAPIAEELVFRGLILSQLRKSMSPVVAAIISSLLFGLAHGTPVWMAYAFLLGLVLCYICIKYGSITASIATHMVFNLLGVIASNAFVDAEIGAVFSIILMIIGLAGSVIIIVLMGKKKKPDLREL